MSLRRDADARHPVGGHRLRERGAYGRRVVTLVGAAAENLRALRARRRLRQADVAAALQLDPKVVSRIEAGTREPVISELPTVCRALGCTLAELFAGADEDDLRALGLL